MMDFFINVRRAIAFPRARQLRIEIERSQKVQQALEAAHHNLELRVQERTKELEQSNKILREKSKTLERYNRVTQNRELEMARLKNEIDALLDELGRPRRYHSPEQSLKTLKIGEPARGG